EFEDANVSWTGCNPPGIPFLFNFNNTYPIRPASEILEFSCIPALCPSAKDSADRVFSRFSNELGPDSISCEYVLNYMNSYDIDNSVIVPVTPFENPYS